MFQEMLLLLLSVWKRGRVGAGAAICKETWPGRVGKGAGRSRRSTSKIPVAPLGVKICINFTFCEINKYLSTLTKLLALPAEVPCGSL